MPDAIKTDSKRAIQKTAETTGDLTGNKIADKITGISKNLLKILHNNDETLHNNDETEEDAEITTHNKRYVSPEEDNKLSINKVST